MLIYDWTTELPGPARDGYGYVYVLAFSTDITKIGSTSNPESRVGKHLNAARGFGTRLVRGWLSRPHREYVKVESALLRRASSAGAHAVAGREWIQSPDFASTIACAEALIDDSGPVPAIGRPLQSRGSSSMAEPDGLLSDEAVAVRAAGLGFPNFGAPGLDILKLVIAERARKSGSKRRSLGRDAIQNAATELREKGYYAVRKETSGRKLGDKKPQWAILRSFSNVPWQHVESLNALSADEVWWHFHRMKAATVHLTPTAEPSAARLSRAGLNG